MDQTKEHWTRTAHPIVVQLLLVFTAIGCAIVLYLLVGVVPKFETMLASLGAERPRLTVVLLALSKCCASWLVVVILLLDGGLVAGFRHAGRLPLYVPVSILGLLFLMIVFIPRVIFLSIIMLQQSIQD